MQPKLLALRSVRLSKSAQKLLFCGKSLIGVVIVFEFCFVISRKLQHPNLSSCIEVECIETGLAILSPLVYGTNLHDHIFTEKTKVCVLKYLTFTTIKLHSNSSSQFKTNYTF